MYNRYDGNTGRFVRIPEPEPPARRQQPALRNPPPPPERRPTYNPPPERSRAKYGPPPARGGGLDSLFPENISGLLGKLVPGALREGLELGEVEGAMSSLSIAVAGLMTVIAVPLMAGLIG